MDLRHKTHLRHSKGQISYSKISKLGHQILIFHHL